MVNRDRVLEKDDRRGNAVDFGGMKVDDNRPLSSVGRETRRKFNQILDSIEVITHVNAVCITSMTDEEIRRGIEVNADTTEYEKSGSVNSILMGSQGDIPCGTCKLFDECEGHEGFIDLKRRILHPNLAKLGIRTIGCVCHVCAYIPFPTIVSGEVYKKRKRTRASGLKVVKSAKKRIKAVQELLKETGILNTHKEERLVAIANYLSSVNDCPNCGAKLRTYRVTDLKKGDNITWTLRTNDNNVDKTGKITPDQIYEIFEKIPDSEYTIMGMYRRNALATAPSAIVVMPPIFRPSVITPTGPREDSLTIGYVNIVKKVQAAAGTDDPSSTVYASVYELMVQNKNTGGKSEAKKKKSLNGRAASKTGLIRKYILGKRTDSAGRNVITCAEFEEYGQFGVPEEFMEKIYVTEVVTKHNIEYYQSIISNSRVTRYKPKSLRPGLRNYAPCNKTTKISIGDIVYRPQTEEDWVVENRQPTLHRQSMLAHRARVSTTDQQFRVHPSDCKPYNADFDGDEMNMNVAQSNLAKAEAECLMAAPRVGQTTDGTNSIGLIGSCVTGIAIASRISISRKIVRECLNTTIYSYLEIVKIPGYEGITARAAMKDAHVEYKYKQAESHNVAEDDGKMLFSMLLPYDFIYNEGSIEIRDGILVKGVPSMSILGPNAQGSISTMLIHDYNHEVNRRFITDATYMFAHYNKNVGGFSISLRDCYTNKKTRQRIQREVLNLELRIEPHLENYDKVESESAIIAMVQDFGNFSNRVATELIRKDPDNALNVMCLISGSKGKITNVKTMNTIVGGVFIGSSRVIHAIDGLGRFIPGFDAGDYSLRAGGFVTSCYMTGMNAYEIMCGDIAARDSGIDTTNRLPVIGEMQRSLTRTFEGVITTENGTVINARGTMISPSCGDGYLADRLIKKRNNPISMPMPIDSFLDRACAKKGIYRSTEAIDTRPGWKRLEPVRNNRFRTNFIPRPKRDTVPFLSPFEKTKLIAELATKLDMTAIGKAVIRPTYQKLAMIAGILSDGGVNPVISREVTRRLSRDERRGSKKGLKKVTETIVVEKTIEEIASDIVTELDKMSVYKTSAMLLEDDFKIRVKNTLDGVFGEYNGLVDLVVDNLSRIMVIVDDIQVPDIEDVKGVPENIRVAKIMLDQKESDRSFVASVVRTFTDGTSIEYTLDELEYDKFVEIF